MTSGMTRQQLAAVAERLRDHAIQIGLTDGYHAHITWATESLSVYLIFGRRKIRVSDHSAAYSCSIDVCPDGLTEAEAVAWLDRERAEEIEIEREGDDDLSRIANMTPEEVRAALARLNDPR